MRWFGILTPGIEENYIRGGRLDFRLMRMYMLVLLVEVAMLVARDFGVPSC